MTTNLACVDTEPVLFDVARSILVRAVEPRNSEWISLSEAAGRVAADDVVAEEDLVPYARSAMDGFAVRSIDTLTASADSPLGLPLVGKVFTGDRQTALAAGTVLGISTGSAIPINADAVVPCEQVTARDGLIFLRRPVPAGDCIFPAAEDVRRGEVLLKRGSVVAPGLLGLLAFAGRAEMAVYRRPRVRLLCSGSELVDVGENPECGQVRNSNAYVFAALLSECGADARYCGTVTDNTEPLRSALQDARREADLLVTTGGASVGERDLIKNTLEELGTEFEFRSVGMRPGKPFAFGWWQGLPVCVLPGNPAAAFVCWQQFVRPLVLGMAGQEEIELAAVNATLVGRAKSKAGSRYFLFGRLKISSSGFLVEPLANQCSALVRNPAIANALIALPEGPVAYESGDQVTVQVLDWKSVVQEPSPWRR